MRIAMLFPGQGSQRVGMGSDLVARYPWLAERRFAAADRLLGMELSRLCWEGPEERLRQTENTQPAVFLASIAVLEVLCAEGVRPLAVAGHSLGEYTALVAAGVLRWQDALRLVRRRGELMEAVNRRTPGAMAAVVGLPAEAVERICDRVRDSIGLVEVANYNEPEQTVVSGEVDAVERAGALAREAGAERVTLLDVGAPFHCSLMGAVEADFAADLEASRFEDPALPVVANATGDYVRTGEEARQALRRQVAGPVRWTQTLRRLASDGYDCFVEVGPGRALTGLSRRVNPELATYAVGDAKRVDLLLGKLRA
jgi:[acyl-carrier-protein] S-malonyltransferase